MTSQGRHLLYQVEPSIIPHDLFCASGHLQVTIGNATRVIGRRFVRKRNPFEIRECLVYTDGSCYNHGMDDSVGESIVVYEPERGTPKYIDEDISFMEIGHNLVCELPNRTMDNRAIIRLVHPTSNRAKLYAAVLALDRPWADEAWKTIVVAGDLEYVVAGITDWVWRWQENDWRRPNGQRVANVDLWGMLLYRIQNLENKGVAVKFWKVPRVKGN